MADMMLTGRVYDAETGHAMGISHYLVENGEGLTKAFEIAGKIVSNAPITNFAVIQALPSNCPSQPARRLPYGSTDGRSRRNKR